MSDQTINEASTSSAKERKKLQQRVKAEKQLHERLRLLVGAAADPRQSNQFTSGNHDAAEDSDSDAWK